MKKTFYSVGATIGRPKNKCAKSTPSKNHLIRQASLTPFPRGEGNRRGFTIVELVVALTIIVLVSTVAIGVVAVDNHTHAETIQMLDATNIAENALECFRVARNATSGWDNDAELSHCMTIFEDCFLRALGYTENFEIPIEDNPTGLISKVVVNYGRVEQQDSERLDENKITYTVIRNGATVTIVFTGSVTTEGGNKVFRFDTITITATNPKGEELLETKSYTVR